MTGQQQPKRANAKQRRTRRRPIDWRRLLKDLRK